MIEMQILQQQAQELDQQAQIIEKNISDLRELKLSLEEIEKQQDNQILANIGKRIYLPVEIKDKELFVEIGKGNFVKKSIPDTNKVVEEQIKKLIIAKDDVNQKLDELQKEAMNLMTNLQEKQKESDEDKN